MLLRQRITLEKNIPAIPLELDGEGSWKCGLVCQLPEGEEVLVCGHGFNASTAKAWCNGQFYFIFIEDFETPAVKAAGV